MVLLALFVAACSAPGGPSEESHNSVDCASLARMGVSTCPPANPQLQNPRLTNDTGGRVSKRDFNTYARGYLRNVAYQTFALNTNQPALLRAGILSSRQAVGLTFRPPLQILSEAASDHGYLVSYGPILSSARLVVLPPPIQEGIRAAGYQPSRVGWVATFDGPAWYVIVVGSRFTVLQSISAHAPAVMDLTWGTYQPKSSLGPIWQIYGDTKCSAAPLWESFCQQ